MDDNFMNMTKGNYLAVPRYSLESWQILFPKSSIAEWENRMHPEDLILFVNDALLELAEENILSGTEKIAVVNIGSDFLDYVMTNNLSYDVNTVMRYCSEVANDEEELQRLFNKENGNEVMRPLMLPVTVSFKKPKSGKLHLKLSDKMRHIITGYFMELFDTDIYVPPYIFTGKSYLDNVDTLITEAALYSNDIMPKWDKKLFTQDRSDHYYIPVFMFETVDSAIFLPSELFHDAEGNIRKCRMADNIPLHSTEVFPEIEDIHITGITKFLHSLMPDAIRVAPADKLISYYTVFDNQNKALTAGSKLKLRFKVPAVKNN